MSIMYAWRVVCYKCGKTRYGRGTSWGHISGACNHRWADKEMQTAIYKPGAVVIWNEVST